MAAYERPLQYLPLKIYFPHDDTAEIEGRIGVKIRDTWEQRTCAVRGNYLFIFKDVVAPENNESQVAIQESSTSGKKFLSQKKDLKTK